MKFVAVLALFAASVSTLRTTRDEEHELFFKCDRIGGEKCGHLIGFRSCCQPGKCEGSFVRTCPDNFQLKDSGI